MRTRTAWPVIPTTFVCALALVFGCNQGESSTPSPQASAPTAPRAAVTPPSPPPAPTPAEATAPAATPKSAEAKLAPTQGNQAHGTVTFTPAEGGVRVVVHVEGLEMGAHGFHVHEKGDCSAPDASSAGGHFAPHGSPHGAPDAEPSHRHVGDLGNLEADASGKADADRIDSMIELEGDASVIGKAVIVHENKDDFTTQPSGNAGARIACGVIEGTAGTPSTAPGTAPAPKAETPSAPAPPPTH